MKQQAERQEAPGSPEGGRWRPAGTLLVATGNSHKACEIRDALAGVPLVIRTLADVPGVVLPEETGATLEDNAVLKARAAHEATGLPSLADDTGLEVEALNGRPGVRSARYAGEAASYEDNCRLLLQEMQGLLEERRTAVFRTVLALYRGDGRILLFTGAVQGRILEERRGSAGFGYDPLFLHPESGRTFAEMSVEEKNRVSHRGKALRKLGMYFRESADPAAKAAPTDGLGHLGTRGRSESITGDVAG
ncbi:MAG: RdgB/HAM1 family non-canonical purine NTP pyrophosphatase [Gemmatimonadetes bacterium]|nr:RdgB/HAM1 family non-canonical purine NTP pyrophosphatase [Gemmatimonadota bacterium]